MAPTIVWYTFADKNTYVLTDSLNDKIQNATLYANEDDYVLDASVINVKIQNANNYANKADYGETTAMNSSVSGGPKIQSGDAGTYANQSNYLTEVQMDNHGIFGVPGSVSGGVGPKIKSSDHAQYAVVLAQTWTVFVSFQVRAVVPNFWETESLGQ